MHLTPLSQIDDGMNDITMVRSSQSRAKLLKLMLTMENGDFWIKSSDKSLNGHIDPSLGLEYSKANEWELRPVRKGPVPHDCAYTNPPNTATHPADVLSIDGEKYPT